MSRTDKHLPNHLQRVHPSWAQVQWTHWGCGCKLCTGQIDRKLNRRRERAAQRAILAELVKCQTDRWDVDYHIPHIGKWTAYGFNLRYIVLGKGPANDNT